MSIRMKAIAIIGATAVLLIVGLYATSFIVLFRNIEHQEKQAIEQNMERIAKLISSKVAAIDTTCGDWALWDNTYSFIADKNSDFITENLVDATFLNLGLSLMMYVDLDGNIVFGKGFDLNKKSEVEIPDGLKKYIHKGNPLLMHMTVNSSISGILLINEKPLMISSRPISTSDLRGTIKGTLIIGRFLEIQDIDDIEGFTNSKVALISLKPYRKENEFAELLSEEKTDNGKNLRCIVRPLDQDFVAGYSMIRDVYKNPALVIKSDISRTIYKQGNENLVFFTIAFLVFVVILFAVCLLLMQKTVISRLEKLSQFINKIRQNKDIKAQVKISGKDEISGLSEAINRLLAELGSTQNNLSQSENRLKLVLEGANDGFWDWDILNGWIYLSAKCMAMFGYDEKEFNGDIKFLSNLLHPEDRAATFEIFEQGIKGEREFCKIEHRVRTVDNNWKWVLNKGKVVEWDQIKRPLRMTGTISDITEQKKAEEEISYLSYHDKLTGLYNRAFFDKELEKTDRLERLPYTIILGDLNGLKITNDTFGHTEGDQLLIKIAQILARACRNTDVVARWGGDEFAVLLQGLKEDEAMDVCNRIRKMCCDAEGLEIKPSIALGTASKTRKDQSLGLIIKEAEEKMYRNKLLESRSVRSSNLSSLEQTLYEKSCETEEHAKRIRQICELIGRCLNLSADEMDELVLVAALHDIGKVAIPDNILVSPNPLTEEEWQIMRRHCEIGCRIARSSPELAHVSDAILSHHERFDGKGYPQGLRGKEIPLLSRIVAIADAFDVMTHDRPYRKAISKKEALEEIRKNSGTQFDPELVEIFLKEIHIKSV
ncbi:MAG: diguanylate cyclase [Clostridia bacterium]|nr:diguanylate cyclase [Clostridia bacterium]